MDLCQFQQNDLHGAGSPGNTSVLGGRIFISRGQKLIHMQKNAAEHAGERGNAFQICKRCTWGSG